MLVIYAKKKCVSESSSPLVTLLQLRFYLVFCLVKHCCWVLVICFVGCSEIGLTVGPLIVCTYNYVQAFDHEQQFVFITFVNPDRLLWLSNLFTIFCFLLHGEGRTQHVTHTISDLVDLWHMSVCSVIVSGQNVNKGKITSNRVPTVDPLCSFGFVAVRFWKMTGVCFVYWWLLDWHKLGLK